MNGSAFLCCCVLFTLTLLQATIISSAKSSITDKVTTANLTTLRLVQIIARHGDRAPILPFPTDVYTDPSVYSINGWGELSELGAKQVYELGAYLRQRYDGFLPRKYRKRDFLMLSSDIDRAIMSAEANLAGLYELGPLPRSRDIFREWQPVPIHTIPQEEDNLINLRAPCPLHYSLYKQYLASEEYANFLAENKEFIDFVTEQSGLAAIAQDFREIFQVQDALRCQYLHNLTLPTWVNSTVYSKLQFFKATSFVWNVKNDKMKMLKIGPLFGRLVAEMQAKVEASNLILNVDNHDDNNDDVAPYEDPIMLRKMYVYSGHDSTISAILDTLNLFQPPHIPPYASALIIELHKTPGSGDFWVELLYKNDTTQEPHKLDLELAGVCNSTSDSSSSQCSFQEFTSFVEKFVPKDWKAECQLQNKDGGYLASAPLSSHPVLSASSDQHENRLLMKTGSNDKIDHNLDPATVLESAWNSQNGSLPGKTHPLGMSAPGLPGFVLAVVAVMSLLVAAALVSTLLWHKPSGASHIPMSASSAAYQQLS